MVQDPVTGGSGGGGAIYKDAVARLFEKLAPGESVTVPDGERWVVTGSGYGASSGSRSATINGETIYDGDGSTVPGSMDPKDFILDAGDTLSVNSDTGIILYGWVVEI